MLDYEWSKHYSSSSVMLSRDQSTQDSADQQRNVLGHYDDVSQPLNQTLVVNNNHPQALNMYTPNPQLCHFPYNHPVLVSGLSYPPPAAAAMLSLETPVDSTSNSEPTTVGFMLTPKTKPVRVDYAASSSGSVFGLNLNLGGRSCFPWTTTFTTSEEDFVNGLYPRVYGKVMEYSRMAMNMPKCQSLGCNADLSQAKQYHRRHKVCKFHSKAANVVVSGLTQRFCQQCSRFHLLSEFDNGKRSCRKRLADHNRRRRKSQPNQEHKSHIESTFNK